MASGQSGMWRGVRTVVAVVLTAGLSVAALYTWYIHRKPKSSSEDEESERTEENDAAQEQGEPAPPKEESPAPPKEESPAPPKEESPAPPKEESPAPPKEESPAPPKEESPAPKESKSPPQKEESQKDAESKVKESENIVKASEDTNEEKGKSLETPLELEITPKKVENNEEPSKLEKSPEIPQIKSLRIDSADKARVLVLGLDRAGKSTFVSALCGKPIQAEYAPTQGFAVVTTTIGNKALNFWEVGGALKLRQHWDHYIDGTQVLVYIIDSASLDTVNVAKVELLSLVETNKHLETIPWLIVASKQDLPGAMNPEELREILNIPQVPKKPEKIVIGMELPAKGLKKGISQIKNYFTLTDF